MTTYKDIHGTAVQNVAGNPDNPQKGQLWYDSTNSEFKFQDQVVGDAWSTQADMNTAREGLSGSGVQTAALGWGGATDPGSIRAETEFWNGSTWTEVNDLNQSKTLDAGAGTVYGADVSDHQSPSIARTRTNVNGKTTSMRNRGPRLYTPKPKARSAYSVCLQSIAEKDTMLNTERWLHKKSVHRITNKRVSSDILGRTLMHDVSDT